MSYLFSGSFKKQAKFNRFIQEQKEVVTLTMEPVPEELYLQPFIEEGYPTNAEYVQVVQTLIAKYPFLKDLEGNGYHTWHQSLKRKFKAERAPLVHQDEVRRVKEKFGHKRKKSTLTDAAEKWHRFVSGLWEEVDRLHPSSVELCRRWREGFTGIVPNVMKLVGERSPLAKMYREAREELLAEELPEADFCAALILLPLIFKEKVEHFILIGTSDSPYPTVQLVDGDWKMAFTRKVPFSVKVDSVDLCQGTGVEDGVMAAFCAYFVFNLAYPTYMKKRLTFLQRTILNITFVGDKALPVTVTRMINLLL